MNLDDELRAALRREDPSSGFTGRVMARTQSRPVSRIVWAAAIAAMLMIGLVSTAEYRQIQGERAARQAVLALRIAAEKLNMTRDKVLRLEN
jgi:hypothetical protein